MYTCGRVLWKPQFQEISDHLAAMETLRSTISILPFSSPQAGELLDLVELPPPFSNQNSKIVGAQKVPRNFWIGSEPPSHYEKYSK